MKIICTICSRSKREDAELLLAGVRYVGVHISKVKEIAANANTPLYILSGKYGLISTSTEISYYDYYLEDSKVNELAQVVAGQIHEQEITEIDFYMENKPSWEPYRKVINLAVQQSKTILRIHDLDQ